MRILIASVILLCSASATRCAETLDTVEELIAKSWKSINSLSYEIEVVMASNSGGVSRRSTSNGTHEQRRKDDKWLVHVDDKAISSIGNIETKVTFTTVFDGEMLYSLSVTEDGMKFCSKSRVDNKWSEEYDDMIGFKRFRANLDLRLLPEELVDGKAVYVIEAGLRGEKSRPCRHYYSKESGISLGCKIQSEDGKSSTTIIKKNIKINPPIADERFKFTPPPGVQVQEVELKKGN